ncbi:MAG TPA: HAMP domain-containing sensor histidine kinase [Solirubrobacteraceae bacterium]|nr:HAMP domain-containing sensor histidine kinase [Solirubrobacteraceae bacterium]
MRGRIVGAVVVTTVATLAVAAIALLGPLENSLRHAALATLQRDVKGQIVGFKELDLNLLPVSASTSKDARLKKETQVRDEVQQSETSLGKRLGASVTLLGFPDANGLGFRPVVRHDAAIAQGDAYDDATDAFRTGKGKFSFGTIAGVDNARAALPIKKGFVLVVRRPIDEIPSAVHAVRTAFLTAALAGLALTLILAIPLAGRIVARLRRLREAALRMAQEGPYVEVEVDRARDEVGDLARTFALMQLRLQQQEEARRAFVATASHELRTPLTSLEGMLEMLDEDLQGGDTDLGDARALLDSARAQSRRLARLAADLLDLSRLDAQVELRSEPVELSELSRAVMAEFELGTAERRIVSELDDAGGPVWALGDPGSVARILRILLDNAVRASPDGAEIRIQTRNGPVASLTVCDEGPGVTLEERELIFERFQRGRDTAGQAGFGLGLAIGRELAERMGGELGLDPSFSPGARFTLTLPVAHAIDAGPVPVA